MTTSPTPKEPHVILVDEHDRPLGSMPKMQAHQSPHLHRAFSVFILKKTDVGLQCLLQQRAHNKYHCPGEWTNACCSHPEPNEKTSDAAERRLTEELGITLELTPAGHFIYQANFLNGLYEHEYDHVYVGWMQDENLQPNPREVADVQWVPFSTLADAIPHNPEAYTPWLLPAYRTLLKHLPACPE
jgi:isopentenyl-diphosphate Delta-isomerase